LPPRRPLSIDAPIGKWHVLYYTGLSEKRKELHPAALPLMRPPFTYSKLLLMKPLRLLIGSIVASLSFLLPAHALAGKLIGSTSFPSNLISIDRANGNASLIGPLGGALGVRGSAFVAGLAFDPTTKTLYGLDGAGLGNDDFDPGDSLIVIDPDSGEADVIGLVGFSTVASLAFDANSSMLYGVDRQRELLLTIDTNSGESAVVGGVGFDVLGLAFDTTTGTLFGSALFKNGRLVNELIRIDTTTGAGTSIGPIGFESVTGLAFDSVSKTLFGTSVISDDLIAIDTSTGVGTAVGAIGVDDVLGLTFVVPEPGALALLLTAAALRRTRRRNLPEKSLQLRRYTCGSLCNAFSVTEFVGGNSQGRPLTRPTLG
jgi:hypothetical protein